MTNTFTILNTKLDLDTIAPIGTTLRVMVAESQFNKKALRAFAIGETESVGFVGQNKFIPGTQLNDELYDLMKENDKLKKGIEVIVVGHDKLVLGANGQSEKVALVVQVVETEILATESAPLAGDLVFDLQVKGSAVKNPKKSFVIQSLLDGNAERINLEFVEDENAIVAMFDGQRAGVVDPKSPGYDDAMKVLATLKTATATVKNPANATYVASMVVTEETMVFIKTGKRPLTLADIKEEKSKFIPMERLDRIQKYMEEKGLSQKNIMKVMETYKEYPAEVQSRIPEPTVAFNDSFGGVKKTVVYLNKGKHLRLVGEKGTGKNLLTTTLAWIYQRPLFELSMNAQTDKLDLLGSKTFVTEEVDGKEVTKIGFQKEALVEAMEYGGFLNLDEVNAADPAVLVLLHSIVDDRGTIEVPSYGRVQADDNFGIILTMNADYIGTTQLNEATRDRFTPIIFPNNDSIAKLLKARVPSAKSTDIALADRIYKDMMKLVVDGRLSMDCITVRGFIDALEVLEDLGIEEAMIDNVVNRVEDAEYRLVVKNIVDDIVG